MPQICDYQGTDYRRDFWQARDRRYEDAAEKAALRRLLPSSGGSIIDLGGGFGRLTPVYVQRFCRVVVFDYASDLLDQAKNELAGRIGEQDYKKIDFRQGDIYHLPFAKNSFEAALCVRVAHHLEDLPAALKEITRVLVPGGVLILEFANKRNFLEIMRWLLRRPNSSPFSHDPFPRGRLFFNFHPAMIRRVLDQLGFKVESQLSVSNFRLPLVKSILPVFFLVLLDRLLMGPLGPLTFGPSVFVRCRLKC